MSVATREALRAGLQLGLVTILAVGLVVATHALTRDRIAASEQRARLEALQLVLPPAYHDNDPLADTVQVQAPAWLGLGLAEVRRATLRGQPSALVMDVEAPDGYAGPIRMLVAVDSQGRVLGVRVLTHSETPGLGDAIEARRSDWITRFSGRSLDNPVPAGWALSREGGEFDQFAGATVTPRAVVSAVKRSLQFAAAHGREVWAADTGATLVFTTLPDPGASP